MTGFGVNIRLPIGLGTQVARWIPGRHVLVNGTTISVDERLGPLRPATAGQIVAVDRDDSTRVVITREEQPGTAATAAPAPRRRPRG